MKFLNLFINNFRRGLATNSSSSHSLVYFATKRPDHDTAPLHSIDTEFGWGMFKLTTLREKLVYALTQKLAVEGYSKWRDDDASVDAAFEQFGPLFPELSRDLFEEASQGYIDHQSVTDVDTLIKAARDPKVEIWGGNDNGGDPHDPDWGSGHPEGYVDHEYLG